MDLSRLRSIVRGDVAGQRPVRELTYEPCPEIPSLSGAALLESVAARAGARIFESAYGPAVVIERKYEADERHGTMHVAECDVTARHGFWLLHGTAEADVGGGRTVFLDLETTGLSGGAGTCAFLVGCGFFEDQAFVTRQFFLPAFSAERALLATLADWLAQTRAIVTYNGRSFDLPLIETRWQFHRMPPPLAETPHLDMLHPARRLWRGRTRQFTVDDPQCCRLVSLERALFGFTRWNDVAGWEIPSRYFDYLRSANVDRLDPVFEHNRLDLLSLAAVTARACHLVEQGPFASDDGHECLSLGRLYEQLRLGDRAEACFERALNLATASGNDEGRGLIASCDYEADYERAAVRTEALRCLARRLRRQRRHDEAARAWQQVLDVGNAGTQARTEAVEALAVHHEHRSRDFERARAFAVKALESARTDTHRTLVEHRLSRLDRKLGAPGNGPKLASLQWNE